MSIIITTAILMVIALCALAFKVAKKEDERFADMNRRLKKLEMNNNTEGI